ncbi:MAG: hypothetical protein HYZ58_12660 [Acidobacteria bacterium]|nr:hypothetical protein [Acidobacteriota bacterium]
MTPFFDGWYENPDGTFTLSFGYSNLNRDEVVEIPLGPDNFIEPKVYDGRQPTSFPPAVSDSSDGGGRRGDRRERERGVFTVTVPVGFRGDVVWTLRHRGQTFSVPGRSRTGAYQLRWPMAMGSVPPLLRFKPNGPAGRGPVGTQADPVQTALGAPLSLMIWIIDDSVREKDPVRIVTKREAKAAMNVTWYKHSGPGPVVFSSSREPMTQTEGTATTSATFKQAGEYVIRVRADNFGRLDTSPGNQCCWTNGYVKVTVTPSP